MTADVAAEAVDVEPVGTVVDALLARAAEEAGRGDGAAQVVGVGGLRSGRDVPVLLGALRDRVQQDGALRHLVGSAALSGTEAEVLGLLVATSADARRGRLLAWLNDDDELRCTTLGTLTTLYGGDRCGALAAAPGAGLRTACLLREEQDRASWAETPVSLHPDVLWWCWSDGERLPPLPAGVHLRPLSGDGTHAVVVASGPDATRRLEAVDAALAGWSVLVSPLPATEPEWDRLVRTATLAGAGVVLEVVDALPATAVHRMERARHLSWAVSTEHDLPAEQLPRGPWFAAPVAAAGVTAEERAAVPGLETGGAGLTASQLAAVRDVLQRTGGDAETAVRRLAVGAMSRLAERIVPTRGWDDLVLPDRQAGQLRHLVARARHRDLVHERWGFPSRPSRGVVGLFAGDSGTGKTMAAEVVAGALGLDVYRVDLSRLVDKYIGETEKNLSAAFDAAAASPVVLFFDEADAVLGKRSAVQDSSDRFANLQVAHLLQRLERHDGVVVLATNLPGDLDPAFGRRIHVTVDFPLPGPAERRAIWRRAVPDDAPREPLDLDRLAEQHELSGGAIRNAAQTAAFLAAEAGTGLTMQVLERAVRDELVKAGRLVVADGPPS